MKLCTKFHFHYKIIYRLLNCFKSIQKYIKKFDFFHNNNHSITYTQLN